jgi:hypothetical protein
LKIANPAPGPNLACRRVRFSRLVNSFPKPLDEPKFRVCRMAWATESSRVNCVTGE